MAEKNISWLLIDDDIKIRKGFKGDIEYNFPNIEVIDVDTLNKGIQAVANTKKPFNVVSCDILINDARIRDAGGKITIVSPIEFLKDTEAMHPQTHLAIISAIRPEEELKGLKFLMKGMLRASEGKLHEFINSVVKNPWKKPAREKINLEQFMRPIVHVDPTTGRREIIQVVKGAIARDDKTLLNMLRQGWRPQTREKTIRNLEVYRGQFGGGMRKKHVEWIDDALQRLKGRKPIIRK